MRQCSGMSLDDGSRRVAAHTLHRVPRPDGRTHAVVEWWSDEKGWGALSEDDETPGGAFVHFSVIQTDPNEYRTLRAGQRVDAVIEGPLPFEQDGYRYRATAVWPLT
jgi:cold shock CspA family protein